MPRFEPFRALRYDLARVDLADVVAPPYDVIGPEDGERLAARSPYNVVHVDLARDDDGPTRYDVACGRFQDWRRHGILTTDPEPAFYLYSMGWRTERGDARQTTGVVGALELDAAGTGQVLPHERIMAKPMDDRLRLMRACKANLSPIWCLSLAPGLDPLVRPEGPPLARCTDDDGVHHRLWRTEASAAVEAIGATVGSAPVVIADGHHRYETALAYRAECRAASGEAPGPYDLVLAYVTGLDDNQIGVRAIHRLITGLPEGFPVVEALSASFVVEPAGVPAEDLPDRMAAAGALGLALPGQAYLLGPRDATAGSAVDDGMVDSERLEAALASFPAHHAAFHHDVATVLALVDKGEAQAAVLLRPTPVSHIADAARQGRRLPQKSTFFHPKPRTGLLFRLLES